MLFNTMTLQNQMSFQAENSNLVVWKVLKEFDWQNFLRGMTFFFCFLPNGMSLQEICAYLKVLVCQTFFFHVKPLQENFWLIPVLRTCWSDKTSGAYVSYNHCIMHDLKKTRFLKTDRMNCRDKSLGLKILVLLTYSVPVMSFICCFRCILARQKAWLYCQNFPHYGTG